MPRSTDTADVPLVDHHCHGVVESTLARAGLEDLLSESDVPAPPGCSVFDSQLGWAVRQHCAPVLGLPAFAPIDDYVARRAELGPEEVNRRLLQAGGYGALLIETGHRGDEILDPPAMAERSGADAFEVVRLERIAEVVSEEVGDDATAFRAGFADALDTALTTAVGVKSIAAYRGGLNLGGERPDAAEVDSAYVGWQARQAERARLDDPVLIRHGVWEAVDRGVPIQFHVGFGDPDVTLHRANPLLLTDLARATRASGASLMLLHCYPFHREAGYLAHVYEHVYCDVGLAVNYAGAQAAQILAESLELTPFHKALFSSDAWGAAELYHLGAVLFRAGLDRALDQWFGADLPREDADHLVGLVSGGNARRVYRLDEHAPVKARA